MWWLPVVKPLAHMRHVPEELEPPSSRCFESPLSPPSVRLDPMASLGDVGFSRGSPSGPRLSGSSASFVRRRRRPRTVCVQSGSHACSVLHSRGLKWDAPLQTPPPKVSESGVLKLAGDIGWNPSCRSLKITNVLVNASQ